MLNESIIDGPGVTGGVIAAIADENLTVAHGVLLPLGIEIVRTPLGAESFGKFA